MEFRNLTNHYHRATGPVYFGGSEAPVLLGKISLCLLGHIGAKAFESVHRSAKRADRGELLVTKNSLW